MYLLYWMNFVHTKEHRCHLAQFFFPEHVYTKAQYFFDMYKQSQNPILLLYSLAMTEIQAKKKEKRIVKHTNTLLPSTDLRDISDG